MGFFSKGEMDLQLPKTNFKVGETITGQVKFKLKKPTKARQFYIQLLGREVQTRMERDHDGHMTKRTDYVDICNIKIPLDKEKEYNSGEYNFNVTIPANALDGPQKPGGKLGAAVEAVQFVSGSRMRIEWSVIANLDIPWGRDLSKAQDITVNPR